MNCLKCNFARKFPGDCKYVVCYRFGGFRRVDGKCPKADELLYLFRCLKVAKWDEEQEEEKRNEEDKRR